jgi:hypothetical protein
MRQRIATNPAFLRYLHMAISSAMELDYEAMLSDRLGMGDPSELKEGRARVRAQRRTAPKRSARQAWPAKPARARYGREASTEIFRFSFNDVSPLMIDDQLTCGPLRFPFSTTFTPSGAMVIV